MTMMKTAPARRDLVDLAGVAKYLGTSERHVRRLMNDPARGVPPLPSYRLGGKCRFDLDQVDEWLQRNKATG